MHACFVYIVEVSYIDNLFSGFKKFSVVKYFWVFSLTSLVTGNRGDASCNKFKVTDDTSTFFFYKLSFFIGIVATIHTHPEIQCLLIQKIGKPPLPPVLVAVVVMVTTSPLRGFSHLCTQVSQNQSSSQ